jgi:hypothetical protein
VLKIPTKIPTNQYQYDINTNTGQAASLKTVTLAAHGLEEFFSSCAVVSVFWLWQEIVLGVTYLPYQLCRCVFFLVAAGNSFGLHRSVFWLWQEIVLGVSYLPTIPVVPLCQFLVAAGNSFWLHSF